MVDRYKFQCPAGLLLWIRGVKACRNPQFVWGGAKDCPGILPGKTCSLCVCLYVYMLCTLSCETQTSNLSQVFDTIRFLADLIGVPQMGV